MERPAPSQAEGRRGGGRHNLKAAELRMQKLYAVDVAGEEGELDCNLTLISAEFETADLQSIAVELATKVKGLNLGIGYFCIAFQTDDYTLTALSSLDNLVTQEAAEISTKAF